MTDDPFASYDAAYVLGALTPEDRYAFEAHLEVCRECARAVRELAGLPGLLSQVPADALDPVAHEPRGLRSSLMRRVRRIRLRRRWTTAGALAAAAALVVVVAFPLTAQEEPGTAMVALGEFPVEAVAQVKEVPGGSRVDMKCSYEGGKVGDYLLVAVNREGQVDELASWRAIPDDTAQISVATTWHRADIAALEIRTTAGKPLLRWEP
ncbi:anti-sigma factor [Amycolatopsis sp. 195334CR]|uniref:anti-sigma factor family protein n=1 Tax=Amycolatopsis sp. 195334CR TaxID=2814588 RepID=UPI001A8E83D3|nr:zf-HC2 domain-containing protein [Amycolatopsis sp. 195334CR]MBN6040823.1 zf-HC2 domain-containing protein [Amycolatopsis sp. 195334CR]